MVYNRLGLNDLPCTVGNPARVMPYPAPVLSSLAHACIKSQSESCRIPLGSSTTCRQCSNHCLRSYMGPTTPKRDPRSPITCGGHFRSTTKLRLCHGHKEANLRSVLDTTSLPAGFRSRRPGPRLELVFPVGVRPGPGILTVSEPTGWPAC